MGLLGRHLRTEVGDGSARRPKRRLSQEVRRGAIKVLTLGERAIFGSEVGDCVMVLEAWVIRDEHVARTGRAALHLHERHARLARQHHLPRHTLVRASARHGPFEADGQVRRLGFDECREGPCARARQGVRARTEQRGRSGGGRDRRCRRGGRRCRRGSGHGVVVDANLGLEAIAERTDHSAPHAPRGG